MEKSKLYTRTGDKGTTSLVGGQRISKDDVRLEAYGTVDELNSWIGRIAAEVPDFRGDLDFRGRIIEFLRFVQCRLFDIGGALATDPEGPYAEMMSHPISADDLRRMECEIDTIDGRLPRLSSFVLPGSDPLSADAHIARTVCRRAERRIITLGKVSPVEPEIVAFVNRLSDYLFALARLFAINSGGDEIFWTKNC